MLGDLIAEKLQKLGNGLCVLLMHEIHGLILHQRAEM